MADPLIAALRMQRDAAAQGFDWTDGDGLWAKLAEEIGELRAAETADDRLEELGDLLFMVVNISRHLGIDADAALASANAKFARRFAYVISGDVPLAPIGDPQRLEQMEQRWQEAKRLERMGNPAPSA